MYPILKKVQVLPENVFLHQELNLNCKNLGLVSFFLPADKAANNVVVVWRKYYIEVLKNEVLNSSTFQAITSSESEIVNSHITATNKLKAAAEHSKVPTMYWLPKLHKKPFKFRFISASSKCTTTKISVLLTSALTTIKELIIKYCNKAYQHDGVNYFWSVKNSLEVLDKSHGFDKPFNSVDSYDFSTLYTTDSLITSSNRNFLI